MVTLERAPALGDRLQQQCRRKWIVRRAGALQVV